MTDVRAEEELSEITRGGEHADKGHHKQPQTIDGVPAGNVVEGGVVGRGDGRHRETEEREKRERRDGRDGRETEEMEETEVAK